MCAFRGGLLCTGVEEGQRLGTEGGCDENLESTELEIHGVSQGTVVPQSWKVHLFSPANEAFSES